jgi:osmotically-inducible protein OsmY
VTTSPDTTAPPALRRALSMLRIDELRIEFVSGVLHLHGIAPCYRAKRQAEERAAMLMPGVSVRNHLRVAERAYIDDAAIERDVIRRVAGLAIADLAPLDIKVRDSVVSLRGPVVSEQRRRQLLDAVASVACVRNIEDHLMLLGAEPADTDVARALSEYVWRAMNLPPGAVNVSWRAGLATLTGSVRTETQRQAIEDLVLWHEHVTDVANRIRVVPRPAEPTPAPRIRHEEPAP